jgi:hypothetical protein
MYAEFDRVKITLESSEVWDITFAIHKYILSSVDNHWFQFAKDYDTLEKFQSYVISKLDNYKLLEQFCNLVDRRFLLDEINEEIKKVYYSK